MVWVVVLSVNDKEALSSLTTYVLIYHFDESSVWMGAETQGVQKKLTLA